MVRWGQMGSVRKTGLARDSRGVSRLRQLLLEIHLISARLRALAVAPCWQYADYYVKTAPDVVEVFPTYALGTPDSTNACLSK